MSFTHTPGNPAALAQHATTLGVFVSRLGLHLRDETDERRKRVLERALTIGVAAFAGETLPVTDEPEKM